MPIWEPSNEDRAWVLGREDDDGGFVLEPSFVCTEDFTTWCVRPMLDHHGVCGREARTHILGEELPDMLGERDVIITCAGCGTAMVAQGRAREVDPRVAATTSRYFWEVQQARTEAAGLPEQAVTA